MATALSSCPLYGTSAHPGAEVPGAELLPCRMEERAEVEAAVAAARPALVYHLAAESSVSGSLADPARVFQVNVMGTLNLLSALRDAPDLHAVVLASSGEVYGGGAGLTEDAPFSPCSPYAASKACADLHAGESSLPVVRLRLFNHIGPGQSERFVVSSLAKQIAEIEAGRIPPRLSVGNLAAVRDFTDVRDVARAYLLAADCTPGEAYNVCSGRAVAVGEILEMLLAASDAEIEIAPDPERMRPADVPVLSGSSAKFTEATGWRPEIPLDRTLSDVLDYWRVQVR
ncbi:MAG: GDP-mannose 4,6-dehydratase [Armatimonadota bacterium]